MKRNVAAVNVAARNVVGVSHARLRLGGGIIRRIGIRPQLQNQPRSGHIQQVILPRKEVLEEHIPGETW